MPTAGPEALATLQETIRQLRTIPQLREKQPGTFHLVGQPFVQFHDDDGKLHAELKKLSGTGFDSHRGGHVARTAQVRRRGEAACDEDHR